MRLIGRALVRVARRDRDAVNAEFAHIIEEAGDALRIRVAAPPVEGAANEALTRLMGRALGVAPSAVRIAGGTTGRNKVLAIGGLDAAAVRERLAAASERSRPGVRR